MTQLILAGKLVYDPKRISPSTGKKMRKTHKERTLIVDLPFDDLAAYYRSMIAKRYHLHLQPPLWGAHMTVVGGNEFTKIKNPDAWHKYSHKKVQFKVVPHELYKAWQFWVLPVKDDGFFQMIRDELGLTKPLNFHITVARDYDPKDYPAPRPEVIIPANKLSVGGPYGYQ